MIVVIGLLALVILFSYLTARDQAHFEIIKKREFELLYFPIHTLEYDPNVGTMLTIRAQHSFLVSSSIAISANAFMVFIANIIAIFGGNISFYESLLDRSRRETILRLKEDAIAKGAHEILNLRFEYTSGVMSRENNRYIEVLAYGTAIIH